MIIDYDINDNKSKVCSAVMESSRGTSVPCSLPARMKVRGKDHAFNACSLHLDSCIAIMLRAELQRVSTVTLEIERLT